MTFTPTAEQAAILAAFADGKDLVIQAGAGTGKTSTLKLIANSTEAYGTYLAFNKSIADEAKRSFPHTVRAMTAHSLAWQEHGNKFADRMNAERQGWTPTIQFLNAEPLSFRLHDRSRRNLSAYQVARHAVNTVKQFCQSNDTDISARHVPIVPGLDRSFTGRRMFGENHDILCDRILPLARRVWADVQRTEGVIAFDHSYYLKSWALTEPTIGGQYLMFDESQDAAPVVAGVVNRQKHLQKILVGDSAQQIMAFAGGVDAMQKFSRQPDVTTLTLSESFRFGPVLAGAANVLLEALSAPLRLTGTPTRSTVITTLDVAGSAAADAVLCRTNAGALDEVISLQQQGRRVCLLGGAVDLRRFVEAARELQTTGKTNFVSLMAFESWAQVVEHVEDDQVGSDDLGTMVELVESYGVDVLLRALDACVHERVAEVVVSTAHKAKGREWGAVRVSPDFELDAEAPDEVRAAEMMLAYVAITRAKKMLDPGLLAEWIKVDPASLPASTSEPLPPVSSAQGPSVEPVERAACDSQVPEGRLLSLSPEVYDRLSAAAAQHGAAPEEFAVRLLDGVLSALSPRR